MSTTIVIGPPGTGKTTNLLNRVQGLITRGTPPESIGFISFTKKAVDEAKERAIKQFHLAENQFPYFRTIHSLCFLQLGLRRVQVMQWNHYKKLGESLGMRIVGIRQTDKMSYELDPGEQAIFIESLSRMKCQSLEQTWQEEDVDVSFEVVQLVSDALKEYKESKYLLDFTDMLAKYTSIGPIPEITHLFVDEAQDLCRLQWKVIEKISKRVRKRVIAGDDDQAIFRWSGADVEHFFNLDGDRKILKKSFRLPSTILKESNRVISNIGKRIEKDFKATNDEGTVQYHSYIEDVDFNIGEWLVLVRNTHMIKAIERHLRYEGLFYETQGSSGKEMLPLRAAIAWEELRSGRTITGYQMELIRAYCSKFKSYAFPDTFHTAKGRQLLAYAGTKPLPIWHKALGKMSYEDREYFISCLRKKEKLKGKPRIKISTIHGAKGGEAENVLLCTDISRRTYESMLNNPDDETRVFYVGMTRAKKNLHILEPQTNCYFEL